PPRVELPPGELPPGELLGASVELGHALRHAGQSASVELADDRWETTRVVIVGAGIAGLSAARRLSQAGLDDFVLLELEPQPGGTSRSGSTPVVPCPWGAHYVPAPTRHQRALCDLLGELGVFAGQDALGDPIVAEQFRVRAPEERVFYKGFWQEGLYLHEGASAEDLRQLQAFQQEVARWVAWRDAAGRPAFTLPMARSSDDAELRELDRISLADWLRQRGLDSPRLHWLADYACRDDYGLRSEATSAWAGLFYFAARVPGAESHSRPFITWPEGNGRLVRHLAAPLARQLRLGWAAREVIHHDAAGRGGMDVIAISGTGQAARGYRADRVIFAAPHFLAPYVVRSLRDARPAYLPDFQYGAWAVANLTLDQPPAGRGFPLAWDNVLYESPSLGYVATSYQRGLDHGPAVLTWYYPLCDESPEHARQRLLQAGRDEWAEVALADLQPAHPDIRQRVRRIDVMRWGHAMIRPVPGFIWGAARELATRPLGGLHFAHSDLSGLPLFEEAFYRGTLAAEQVLMELGYDERTIL
ncbi:MAG: FAD-dependent oxidoreductase, partial [Pirellulaceae bacterium]|nr:FAD-dependent oxidoreductase [Pirellulaceae bacterium]